MAAVIIQNLVLTRMINLFSMTRFTNEKIKFAFADIKTLKNFNSDEVLIIKIWEKNNFKVFILIKMSKI
ncbi:hypothetical protein BpHYR1_033984 [Brachionus plicatilis]|uniref:Uncharacterized protein n=1 Tax=Brachionus plicatilis TaxID=10195 RepID=A0A3M7R3X5_BRAPC|nr:hypothetical protein BpHYR1_033984 [Brachionus plicatilis]